MTDLLKASEQFIDVTLVICFIAVSISLVLLTYGVIKGPTNADRAVALDAIGINLMAIAALTAIFLVTSKLNDVILLIGIISFLSTVTIAKYIEKGVIIDRDMD
ncbi:MAG TPA: Na(+)/H(+) antiporter subunit F1 [Bacillota bacterium]|nr:Na(+)/H(+) antiporter subunit F1 [Bacillota bacterium]